MTFSDATIYEGDCLHVLETLEQSSIDLIYLDPPFFTQKTHQLATRSGSRQFSFDDLWASHSEYVRFLMDRVRAMHRVLKQRGVLFFHCNDQCSHLARFVLDDVFGSKMFRSEIIWSYRRWSNSQKGLLPAHQTILFYSKSSDYTFKEISTEYSASTNIEQILQKRRRDHRGKTVYAKAPNGLSVPNGIKKGVPLSDVWDIPYLNPKAKERVGYPTQKPVLLIQRILELCSDEGDVVMDPFCGSGTTLVAAKLLRRRSIGIDTSKDAIELAESRLAQPIVTQSALLERGRSNYLREDLDLLDHLRGVDFHPVQRNKGVDAILKDSFQGRTVLVRIQRRNEPEELALRALRKAAKDKGDPLLVLIATESSGATSRRLPKNFVIVPAAGLALRRLLDQCSGESHDKQMAETPEIFHLF